MKIYDCFIFFNELDLLEIRLNELKENVDYFVLVEATKTFSGKEKELHYLENKERYSQFKDKIIHIVVEDLPECVTNNRWPLEEFQRNCISRGLKGCKSEDIIFLSDIDEIPKADKIREATNLLNEKKKKFVFLEQEYFCYYLNGKVISNIFNPWVGTIGCKYETILNQKLNFKNLREIENKVKHTPKKLREIIYKKNIIKDGGWHFSFLGGKEKIIEKIESFSHAEYDNKEIKELNFENILIKGKSFTDSIAHDIKKVKYIKLNKKFPKYLVENRFKFKDLIYKDNKKTFLSKINNLFLKNDRYKPKLIKFELTNYCNFDCDFCPHRFMKRDKGFMDYNFAIETINKVCKDELFDNLCYFSLFNMGESFLHPRIFDIIKYAQSKNLPLMVTTNGSTLNKGNWDKLWDSGLKILRISYQTPTEESFTYRNTNITHSTYKLNLFALIEDKIIKNAKTMIFIYLLNTKKYSPNEVHAIENNDQVEVIYNEFLEFAKEIVKKYNLNYIPKLSKEKLNSLLDLGDFAGLEILPGVCLLLRESISWGIYKKNICRNRGYCELPFYQLMIYWNGDCGLCAIDYDVELNIGNIKKKSFKEVWYSKKAKLIRKQFLNNNVLMEKCKYCDNLINKNDNFKQTDIEIFGEGWHNPKVNERWSERRSKINFKNSCNQLEFEIEGMSKRLLKSTQKIRIKLNGKEYLNLELDRRKKIKVNEKNIQKLEFESDSYFIPSKLGLNQDTRELSFKIIDFKIIE